MAGSDRTAADRLALFAALEDRPHQFDFYQALRRLEALFADQPRFGRSLRPADDVIRLTEDPSLAFAPATLAAFRRAGGDRKPRLAVAFGGLFGPQGPLPLHLTEYARDRIINAGDPTFARFLDIFHHRMLSLVYRAWADAQPTVQFDRPENDRFQAYIGALIGLGHDALADRDAMPDLAKRYFAGRLVCHARNAEGLQAILSDFFRLPMRLVEFVGRWLRLPDDCRCVLRSPGHPQSGSAPRDEPVGWDQSAPADAGPPLHGFGAQLGHSATIGERVWDCQTKFRIVAGPMSLPNYLRLLPGGISLARLEAIVKNYVSLELDWDLHLVLKRDEVPPSHLGFQGQLGWTTWLVSQPKPKDADDLILTPQPA